MKTGVGTKSAVGSSVKEEGAGQAYEPWETEI